MRPFIFNCPPLPPSPTPGSEWVMGHMEHCKIAAPFCGDECTCPHSTMVVAALPAGTVGLGVVRDGSLFVWFEPPGEESCFAPLTATDPAEAPWREAWWKEGAVLHPDGLYALVRVEEECPKPCRDGWFVTDGGLLRRSCGYCSGSGRLVAHRMERVACTPELDPDLIDMIPKRDFDRWPVGNDALIFAPSRESLDSGEIGEWFMVERNALK